MADRDPQPPPLLDRLTPTRVGVAAGATFFAGLITVLSVSKGAPVWLVVVAPLVVGLGAIVLALSKPVGGGRGTDAAPFDREPDATAEEAAELRSAAAEARKAAAEALAAAEKARQAAGLVAVSPPAQAPRWWLTLTTPPADLMTELQIDLAEGRLFRPPMSPDIVSELSAEGSLGPLFEGIIGRTEPTEQFAEQYLTQRAFREQVVQLFRIRSSEPHTRKDE